MQTRTLENYDRTMRMAFSEDEETAEMAVTMATARERWIKIRLTPREGIERIKTYGWDGKWQAVAA